MLFMLKVDVLRLKVHNLRLAARLRLNLLYELSLQTSYNSVWKRVRKGMGRHGKGMRDSGRPERERDRRHNITAMVPSAVFASSSDEAWQHLANQRKIDVGADRLPGCHARRRRSLVRAAKITFYGRNNAGRPDLCRIRACWSSCRRRDC